MIGQPALQTIIAPSNPFTAERWEGAIFALLGSNHTMFNLCVQIVPCETIMYVNSIGIHSCEYCAMFCTMWMQVNEGKWELYLLNEWTNKFVMWENWRRWFLVASQPSKHAVVSNVHISIFLSEIMSYQTKLLSFSSFTVALQLSILSIHN